VKGFGHPVVPIVVLETLSALASNDIELPVVGGDRRLRPALGFITQRKM